MSLTREIIGGGGMALRRPAFGPPVINEAECAHIGLESIRLARGGVGRVPNKRQGRDAHEAALETVFIGFEHSFRCPGVQVNPIKRAESRQSTRHGRTSWGHAQESRCFLENFAGIVSWGRLLK